MRKIKVPYLDGTYKTGELIGIKDQKEPWAEYYLDDGSILRLRQVIVKVVRLDEKDTQGNPIYVFEARQISAVLHGDAK